MCDLFGSKRKNSNSLEMKTERLNYEMFNGSMEKDGESITCEIFSSVRERNSSLELEIEQLMYEMFSNKVKVNVEFEINGDVLFEFEIEDYGSRVFAVRGQYASRFKDELYLRKKSKSESKMLLLDLIRFNSGIPQMVLESCISVDVNCCSDVREKAVQIMENHIKDIDIQYLSCIEEYLHGDDERVKAVWLRNHASRIESFEDTEMCKNINIEENYANIAFSSYTAKVKLNCFAQKSDVKLGLDEKAVKRLIKAKDVLMYISNNIDWVYGVSCKMKKYDDMMKAELEGVVDSELKNEIALNLHNNYGSCIDFKARMLYVSSNKIDIGNIDEKDIDYINYILDRNKEDALAYIDSLLESC